MLKALVPRPPAQKMLSRKVANRAPRIMVKIFDQKLRAKNGQIIGGFIHFNPHLLS